MTYRVKFEDIRLTETNSYQAALSALEYHRDVQVSDEDRELVRLVVIGEEE